MKKIYQSPAIEVYDIQAPEVMANSNNSVPVDPRQESDEQLSSRSRQLVPWEY